ncbi:MAG: hypothetical protein M3R01_12020 [Actinomycetota bacterium]|nr:hypothetical protein [Actinomycetota bacterium]
MDVMKGSVMRTRSVWSAASAPLPPHPAQHRFRAPQRLREALRSDPRRLRLTVCVLGGALLFLELFYVLILPQTPARAAKRSAELTGDLSLWSWLTSLPLPVPRSPGLIAASLIVAALVAFSAYGLIVWLTWGKAGKGLGLIVAAFVAASFVISALALPNLNSDVYDYILFGRVVAEHDSNPAYTFPDEFPDDPVYPYSSHQYTDARDNKLPAWTVLSVGLAHLGGDDPVNNLLLFRFALLTLNLGAVGLIWLVLRRLQPAVAVAGIALYGLNPIVTMQGQSKTDTVMAFFLLASIALLVTKHRRSAVVALAVSMFVKLITMPLAAVFWVRELRLRRWSNLVVDVVAVGVVVFALYAPFSRGFELLFDNLGMLGSGGGSAPDIVRPIVFLAFALFILAVGLRQEGSTEQLLRGWALVSLVFGVLLSRPGLSWYLIVALAVVAVAAEWRMAVASVVLTFSSFLVSSWTMMSSARYPLPDIFEVPRPLLFVAPLGVLAALAILWRAWHHRLHRNGHGIGSDGSVGTGGAGGSGEGDSDRRLAGSFTARGSE